MTIDATVARTDVLQLSSNVAEAVFERFGFPGVPEATRENLDRIYNAWSEKVGYDNVNKRIYFGTGATGPLPNPTPEEFLSAWLRHGTAGSCWNSALSLAALFQHAGYPLRFVAGSHLDCGDPTSPNHGTFIVSCDGRDYMADTGMMFHDALELIDGVETSTDNPATGAHRTTDGKVWWRPGHTRDALAFQVEIEDCTPEQFIEWYEGTKNFSLFNATLYVRRNLDGGTVTYGRGHLVTVAADNSVTVEPVADGDLPDLLVNRLGLSREIVEQLPPDSTDGPAFD